MSPDFGVALFDQIIETHQTLSYVEVNLPPSLGAEGASHLLRSGIGLWYFPELRFHELQDTIFANSFGWLVPEQDLF